MVPRIVVLEALPMTPNGKVDRTALPAPDEVDHLDYTAPRNGTEATIAAVWSDVLCVDKVGIHDNFFTLGGHSLRAVAAATELARAGLPATVQQLVRYQTVAELAAVLAVPTMTDSSLLVEYIPVGRRAAASATLFCIHPSGGSAHWYRLLAQTLGGTCRTLGIQAAGMTADEEPLGSIDAMADRYWREIKQVQPAGPYHLLGGSLGGVVAHALAERNPDEVCCVFLAEPPQLIQPRVRAELKTLARRYADAGALWQRGRGAEGELRQRIETQLRAEAATLEIPPDMLRLDQWIPFDALGLMLSAAAEYTLPVSPASALLLVSDAGPKSESELHHAAPKHTQRPGAPPTQTSWR